jgi:hypothetical protein
MPTKKMNNTRKQKKCKTEGIKSMMIKNNFQKILVPAIEPLENKRQ